MKTISQNFQLRAGDPRKTKEQNQYDEKLLNTIAKTLSVYELNQIRYAKLKKTRHSENMVYYKVDNIKQESHMDYEYAKYWYRSMSKEDFIHLLHNDQVVIEREKDYGGIAPNYKYCIEKFFTTKSKGTHIVEFSLDITGKEFCEKAYEHRKKQAKNITVESPKGEAGGSIGLGPKDMI